jgi:hypothetical protein
VEFTPLEGGARAFGNMNGKVGRVAVGGSVVTPAVVTSAVPAWAHHQNHQNDCSPPTMTTTTYSHHTTTTKWMPTTTITVAPTTTTEAPTTTTTVKVEGTTLETTSTIPGAVVDQRSTTAAAPTETQGSLPFTGSNSALPVTGVVLVAPGAIGTAVARRKARGLS